SLWFDEAFSWRLIQFPLPELLDRVAQDVHPPLYFVLLKGWACLFGDSAVALRSFSAALGVLTVLGIYLVTRTACSQGEDTGPRDQSWGSRATALLAASLVALSVFQVRYSWEARMYALATALAAFSTWALVRALRQPRSWAWWLVYSGLTALLAYTH